MVKSCLTQSKRQQIRTPTLGCAFCALHQRIAEAVAPEWGSTDTAVGHGNHDGQGFVGSASESSYTPITMYELFVGEDVAMREDHEAQMKPARRRVTIGHDTGSQQAFDFIQKQQDKCAQNHSSMCGVPSNSFTPSRLFDVTPINDTGDVSLFVSPTPRQAPAQHYAALSYC